MGHGWEKRYKKRNSPSTALVTTQIATLGGDADQLGKADPQLQDTVLVAKINSQLVGIFKSGKTWGEKLGVAVPSVSQEDSVHAEEHMMAALKDNWDQMVKDRYIKKNENPNLTIKINKTPCPGCGKQLAAFAVEKGVTIRIKAAQLWQGSSTENREKALLSVKELGVAGVVVMPWDIAGKRGKRRKAIHGGGRHELGSIKVNAQNDRLILLKKRYESLCDRMGLDTDEALDQRHSEYRTRSVSNDTRRRFLMEHTEEMDTDLKPLNAQLETAKTAKRERDESGDDTERKKQRT